MHGHVRILTLLLQSATVPGGLLCWCRTHKEKEGTSDIISEGQKEINLVEIRCGSSFDSTFGRESKGAKVISIFFVPASGNTDFVTSSCRYLTVPVSVSADNIKLVCMDLKF